MTEEREWIWALDRIAEGDDELAQEAQREREAAVLKIPMALKVNVASSEAVSPSGVFGEVGITHFEYVHRTALATTETLSEAEGILAQAEDPDDEPPPDQPPAA